MTNANTAGNLIAVYVVWNNTGTVSVSDTRGNTYAPAQAVTRWNNNQWSAQVFYAKDIAAGVNTVRATFGITITGWGIVYAHEYSGLDRASPLDATASAVGTAATANSGNASTTAARTLLLGAGTTTGAFGAAGSGYTTRIITQPDLDILADRAVTAAGAYNATAGVGGAWVMQLVAFRGAG